VGSLHAHTAGQRRVDHGRGQPVGPHPRAVRPVEIGPTFIEGSNWLVGDPTISTKLDDRYVVFEEHMKVGESLAFPGKRPFAFVVRRTADTRDFKEFTLQVSSLTGRRRGRR
jgi:hypothetical protein